MVSADPSGLGIASTAQYCPDLGLDELRADAIVGADGVNSAVRGTRGFPSGVSPRSSYVRAIVRGRLTEEQVIDPSWLAAATVSR